MTDASTPVLLTIAPMTVAVLRETVPVAALTEFFDRAFTMVPSVLAQQGIVAAGPPMAVYSGVPSGVATVAAGVPTATPVSPVHGVSSLTLPAGRVARVIHRGAYDALGESYQALTDWLHEQGLEPGPMMWESYLTEPTPGGDPADLLTEITWPLAR
ncbi:GyrI-like domain-containing protein [Microcella daejeonensis]|uniref:GyrI-like domain-containing protein n=1 Tax=Microcella daejeonensis TaxID=2994971 RepID=A0A9E8MP16_9MICO|nr:GyrI-like domain-containing protein [Microcella daejeonensis]WAB82246.1 GyrI-like domain-containing protein [Microcella daejeonensis]